MTDETHLGLHGAMGAQSRGLLIGQLFGPPFQHLPNTDQSHRLQREASILKSIQSAQTRPTSNRRRANLSTGLMLAAAIPGFSSEARLRVIVPVIVLYFTPRQRRRLVVLVAAAAVGFESGTGRSARQRGQSQ